MATISCTDCWLERHVAVDHAVIFEDEPLCFDHAKARGWKAGESEEPVETKTIEWCACGCGQPAAFGRRYTWGHKPKKGPRAEKPAEKPAEMESTKPASLGDNVQAAPQRGALMVTEGQLNGYFLALPFAVRLELINGYLAGA